MAHDHGHHIIPFKTLATVFGILTTLTILTVITARADLGALNVLHVPIALAIALVKTILVVMFFMALKYDKRVNALVFSVGTIFVLVFIIVTLFDTAYRGDMGNVDPMTVQDRLRMEESLQAREPDAEALQVAPPEEAPTGAETEPMQ
jgi:cytochrome c oxidase subunit 4